MKNVIVSLSESEAAILSTTVPAELDSLIAVKVWLFIVGWTLSVTLTDTGKIVCPIVPCDADKKCSSDAVIPNVYNSFTS